MEKTLYLTRQEIEAHGGKYSKTYNHKGGIWSKDFDAMATKTVLKLLLSKYAPLSVEMQQAVLSDQGVINDFDTMDISYQDNPQTKEEIDPMAERISLMIEAAETQEELDEIIEEAGDNIDEQLHELYVEKSMYLEEIRINALENQ